MTIADYVGIPFKLHGETREGLDCWGLVRLWYREQYGIDLPAFGDQYGREINAAERAHLAALIRGESAEWKPIRAGHEARGHVVLCRIMGDESHLGIVVERGRMLHARPGTDSCVEAYTGPTWARRLAGFYGYAWQ